jgi:hypothetical protein
MCRSSRGSHLRGFPDHEDTTTEVREWVISIEGFVSRSTYIDRTSQKTPICVAVIYNTTVSTRHGQCLLVAEPHKISGFEGAPCTSAALHCQHASCCLRGWVVLRHIRYRHWLHHPSEASIHDIWRHYGRLGFNVLTAVAMKNIFLWVVTTCSLERSRNFRETSPQSSGPKNKASKKPARTIFIVLVSCYPVTVTDSMKLETDDDLLVILCSYQVSPLEGLSPRRGERATQAGKVKDEGRSKE